ncbi:hypothetical protein AB0N37_16560 [Streptomyces griseoincarnatus]|uniref:Uncharacterized protein n=1 Tax=Streptomyces tunisiensis TaxID=948699 RepID=A0ABP7Z416_9ACTN
MERSAPGLAADPGDGDGHAAQRFRTALGTAFPRVADEGVDEQDDGDDDRVLDLTDDADGGGEQEADQPAAEVVRSASPLRRAGRSGRLVGSVAGGSPLGFGRAQARGPGDAGQVRHVAGLPPRPRRAQR